MTERFDNYHFTMLRPAFERAVAKGCYDHPADGLAVEPVVSTPETYLPLLQRFGGPWGWDRRPKYRDLDYIARRLAEAETRVLAFREAGREIGFAMTGRPAGGFEARFAAAHGRPVAEIENIALHPAETGEGKGRWFLGALLRRLFADHSAVCLASRSTNHAGVPRFYRRMGFTLAHTERGLPDDLTPANGPACRVA
ncbi:MAG: GNAT family N-acetyltransferase [Pseudomonadota bacterium]